MLIERHHIRAKLENPGGSVVVSPTRRVEVEAVAADYSTVLGNDFHLDLLDAEERLKRLDPEERQRFLRWCDGVSSQTAAEYASVKPGTAWSRRSRANRPTLEKISS